MTPKQIVIGLAAAATLVGTAIVGVVKKEPTPQGQNCEHVSDPGACAEWLKIKDPTPLQRRLYEDS